MRRVQMQDNGNDLKLSDQQLNLGYIGVYIKTSHGNHKPKSIMDSTQKQKVSNAHTKEEKGINHNMKTVIKSQGNKRGRKETYKIRTK